jgi:hypothetical protein
MADKFDWDAHPVVGESPKESSFNWDDHPVVEAAPEEAPGMLESAGMGLAKGATLGFEDELTGALGAIGQGAGAVASGADLDTILETAKQGYKEHRDIYRGAEKAAEEANPKSFLTGELGSALMLPMGEVGTAAKLAPGAGMVARFGKLLETGARMAPAAAGYGAATAVGQSEHPLDINTLKEAGKGAAVGGAIGLAAPAVLAPVGKAAGSALGTLKSAGGSILSGLEKIPGISDILVPLKTTLVKGINPRSVEEISALQQKGAEQIAGPAKQASEAITKTRLVPEQEALTSLSGELGQQLESGVAAQKAFASNEEVKAAANFLNRIESLGSEAGGIVGQLKKDVIAASDDKKTEALYNAVKKLESIIQESPSLQTEEAQKVLQNYKNAITVQGAPKEASKILSRTTGPDLEPITKEVYKVKGAASPREAEAMFEGAEGAQRTQAELSRVGEKETLKTTDVAKLPEQLSQEANAGQYFKIVDDMGALAHSPQMKGTPLGAAIKQARKEASDMGREAFFGPKGDPIREVFDEANKVYSSKLKLQDRYGIDFNNPGEARSKVLSYAKAVSGEGGDLSKLQGFLDDVGQVDPKLADEFTSTFSKLQEARKGIVEAPGASKIEKAFMESPTSRQALGEVEQLGKGILPEQSLQSTMAKGEASAGKIQAAKEELKNLNPDKLINAAQNLDNPSNIKSSFEFRKFVDTVKKIPGMEGKAEQLMQEPLETLKTLRDIAFINKPGESTLGQARSVIRTISTEAGIAGRKLFDTSVLPKLQKASESDVANWISKAQQANKPKVAQLLKGLNSKDPVAKSATLFMISQQHDIKNDVKDIVGGEETPEGQ